MAKPRRSVWPNPPSEMLGNYSDDMGSPMEMESETGLEESKADVEPAKAAEGSKADNARDKRQMPKARAMARAMAPDMTILGKRKGMM